jgi:hypothetical protein
MQACFAAIPSDPSGRYVYFSLRCPSLEIHRHQRGRPAVESDQIVLRFVGSKEVKLHLAFEKPPLANVRQASQMKRFEGMHELTQIFHE